MPGGDNRRLDHKNITACLFGNLTESFSPLRQRLLALHCGEYAAYLVGAFTEDLDPHELLYEQLFNPIRLFDVKLFEIGILKGASLSMWRVYFPFGNIVGMDIDPCDVLLSPPRITILQGDQTDKERLTEIGETHGPFDIIIDDGGHTMYQQQTSLGVLFKFVKPGGFYVIEDLHTAFCRASRYNNPKQITTLQMVFDYMVHRKIDSPSITKEDQQFLNENIGMFQIWQRGRSKLCCFTRKA